jgi:group II intron reverse transcriptase/maturase
MSPPVLKVHSLTGRITPRLLLQAYKAVKRNRGKAGIDKVSLQMFAANLEANLLALTKELKEGSFQPLPLRRAYVPKNETEMRPLGIPAVRDRIAQEVVRRLLTPYFEPQFHPHSFGYITGRNAQQAVHTVLALRRQGLRVVLDADIKGFFDNLPHGVILRAVADRIADGNILNLIKKFLKSGVMEGGVFKPTTIGTPQGGVISPLLANLVLDQLDWQLHQQGYQFVRYADDFVVLCPSRLRAEEAKALVERVLEGLGLQLSPAKTKIVLFRDGFSFLGFMISSCSCRMRPKSIQKFQQKVRELTVRKHNFEAEVIVKLNRVIRGTAQYFLSPSFATGRRRIYQLDAWVRMRLRAMKFKRKTILDNRRFRMKSFHKLGLLSLASFFPALA